MAKAIRYSEKDLGLLLDNNPNIIVHENNTNKIIVNKEINGITKISLNNDKTIKAKVSKFTNIYQLNKDNKNSKITTTCSENHISLVFEGAKLLTTNQILSFLQRPKLQNSFFTYKKSWHKIVYDTLQKMCLDLKSEGKNLPFFNESVEVTIFRQAPKLVDEDAISTMFKFIIDGLKKTKENPYGVLAEDNPKIVHQVNSYSEKGEHIVGIRVKRLIGIKRETYTKEKLLNE